MLTERKKTDRGGRGTTRWHFVFELILSDLLAASPRVHCLFDRKREREKSFTRLRRRRLGGGPHRSHLGECKLADAQRLRDVVVRVCHREEHGMEWMKNDAVPYADTDEPPDEITFRQRLVELALRSVHGDKYIALVVGCWF